MMSSARDSGTSISEKITDPNCFFIRGLSHAAMNLLKHSTGKWFANIYDYATTTVKRAYRQESKKGDQFVHRNWLRSASTMKAIQEQIADSKDVIHLIDK